MLFLFYWRRCFWLESKFMLILCIGIFKLRRGCLADILRNYSCSMRKSLLDLKFLWFLKFICLHLKVLISIRSILIILRNYLKIIFIRCPSLRKVLIVWIKWYFILSNLILVLFIWFFNKRLTRLLILIYWITFLTKINRFWF